MYIFIITQIIVTEVTIQTICFAIYDTNIPLLHESDNLKAQGDVISQSLDLVRIQDPFSQIWSHISPEREIK